MYNIMNNKESYINSESYNKLNEQEQIRVNKLVDLCNLGINPYPSKTFEVTQDVLKLIDTYGADAVRFGILLSTQAGNDLKYDEQLCIQGRNFTTKLWNALRFIAMQENHLSEQSVDDNSVYNQMLETINRNEKLLEEKYAQYRINEAAMMVYKLIWDDFCSNYLEKIKVPKGQMMSKQVYNQTLDIYEKLMIMLSPFMPFITNLIIKKIKDLRR